MPDWIAVDWGTSRLRVWAMGAEGRVLASAASEDGMSKLARDQFEPALLRLIEPWLGTTFMPVLACGMVGSRQGWHEVGYQPVPAVPSELSPVEVTCTDPRIRLWILPGLSQKAPPDILRGEETQIGGFLAQEPDFDGVLCLPGTHTKWARISAGEVVSFMTAMTGELFELLSAKSVIRHVLGPPTACNAGFNEAVSDALSRPEHLAQWLFAIRANSVLNPVEPAAARSRLSGLLIGAELAAARPYWLGQSVVVAGDQVLAGLYGKALTAQGCQVRTLDAAPMTQRGLIAAFDKMREETT